MTIRTALTDLLGLQAPIILAPMAGISGGSLAAAVSAAGGLGLIGGGYGDQAWLRQQVEHAAGASIGIGFITWSVAQRPEILHFAIAQKPRAIMLSFGDISQFAPIIRNAGIPLIAQVQTVSGAEQALQSGADILVAQGTEAGGHCGTRSTFPLVPAIVDIAGKVPVVAAGGIADGRGLAAALMLGAAGILCGTAFYTASEALTSHAAKRAAIAASGDMTVRSRLFDLLRDLDWPVAWQLRTIRNTYTDEWACNPDGLVDRLAQEKTRFVEACAQDDAERMAIIAGQAVDLVTRQRPAAETVQVIIQQAERLLQEAKMRLV